MERSVLGINTMANKNGRRISEKAEGYDVIKSCTVKWYNAHDTYVGEMTTGGQKVTFREGIHEIILQGKPVTRWCEENKTFTVLLHGNSKLAVPNKNKCKCLGEVSW